MPDAPIESNPPAWRSERERRIAVAEAALASSRETYLSTLRASLAARVDTIDPELAIAQEHDIELASEYLTYAERLRDVGRDQKSRPSFAVKAVCVSLGCIHGQGTSLSDLKASHLSTLREWISTNEDWGLISAKRVWREALNFIDWSHERDGVETYVAVAARKKGGPTAAVRPPSSAVRCLLPRQLVEMRTLLEKAVCYAPNQLLAWMMLLLFDIVQAFAGRPGEAYQVLIDQYDPETGALEIWDNRKMLAYQEEKRSRISKDARAKTGDKLFVLNPWERERMSAAYYFRTRVMHAHGYEPIFVRFKVMFNGSRVIFYDVAPIEAGYMNMWCDRLCEIDATKGRRFEWMKQRGFLKFSVVPYTLRTTGMVYHLAFNRDRDWVQKDIAFHKNSYTTDIYLKESSTVRKMLQADQALMAQLRERYFHEDADPELAIAMESNRAMATQNASLAEHNQTLERELATNREFQQKMAAELADSRAERNELRSELRLQRKLIERLLGKQDDAAA